MLTFCSKIVFYKFSESGRFFKSLSVIFYRQIFRIKLFTKQNFAVFLPVRSQTCKVIVEKSILPDFSSIYWLIFEFLYEEYISSSTMFSSHSNYIQS